MTNKCELKIFIWYDHASNFEYVTNAGIQFKNTCRLWTLF